MKMHRKPQSERVAVQPWNNHSWHSPNSLEKSFGILYFWQHERGARYIMILTDSQDVLSEEQFSALATLHRSEGSAWLGRDLRQAGTGARLESNLSAMNRARVWTNSFTMTGHIQQEAIAREGPLYSEDFLFAGNCDTRRRPQPRHAVCAVITRHS